MTESDIEVRDSYRENGYALHDSIFDEDIIERVDDAILELMDGEYETGVAPFDIYLGNNDGHRQTRVIEFPHLANDSIFELVTNKHLSTVLANIVGAKALQVWGVQLFHKPPGSFSGCKIGWHQDYFFHQKHWDSQSNIFTVWIAISDVAEECGPMRFVAKSHLWHFCDVQSSPREYVHEKIVEPYGYEWNEVAAVLGKGAFSIHHPLTYHGSYSNLSSEPRKSIVIRFRTEESRLKTESDEPSSEPFIKIDDRSLRGERAFPVTFGDKKHFFSDV